MSVSHWFEGSDTFSTVAVAVGLFALGLLIGLAL